MMQKKHGDYSLVEANNTQIEPIKKLVFSVLKEYGLEPGSIDFCLDDIELNYTQKGGCFVVLLDKNKTIIGTGGLYKIDDQSVELRKMYLSSAYRGKGLGRFMLSALIEKAKELTYTRIELETAAVLKEAISLYKKFGFQVIHPKHISDRCDQAYEMILR